MPSKNKSLSKFVSNDATASFTGDITVSGIPVINSSGYFVGPGYFPKGEPGEKGTSGSNGNKGQPGDKGDKGDKGEKGSQLTSATYYNSNNTVVFVNSDNSTFNASGLKGNKGDTGTKGDKGDKGDTGAKGDTGSKGDKGEIGDKGSKGEQVYTVTYTDANSTLAFGSSDGSFFYANGIKGQKEDFLKGDKGDLGVNPNATNTFTALQNFNAIEVTKTQEIFQTINQTVSGALSINLDNGNVIFLNHGANITSITLSNIPSSKAFGFSILRKNTTGASLTISWGSAFKWSGGSAPALTNSLNAIDLFTFITFDGGTTIYSVISGINFS